MMYVLFVTIEVICILGIARELTIMLGEVFAKMVGK